VDRSIMPERVLGRAGTMLTSRSETTAPIVSRTRVTSPALISTGSRVTPALSTAKPRGTWPFRSSLTPMTAHSAMSGWPAITSSISPVDKPVPGDVDHVVDAAHHEHVAVLGFVAAVARQVVAGIPAQAGCSPSGGTTAGR